MSTRGKLERVPPGGARGGTSAPTVARAQQEHRQGERVVEHQALHVGRRSRRQQRIAGGERSAESALRGSGVAHCEHMFAGKAAAGSERGHAPAPIRARQAPGALSRKPSTLPMRPSSQVDGDVEPDRERLAARRGHELPREAHDVVVGVDAVVDESEDVTRHLLLDGADEVGDPVAPRHVCHGVDV